MPQDREDIPLTVADAASPHLQRRVLLAHAMHCPRCVRWLRRRPDGAGPVIHEPRPGDPGE